MSAAPHRPHPRVGTTLGLLVAIAACGGGDPGPDGDPVVTTYEGVMAIGSETSAAITLVSSVPPAGAAGVAPTGPSAAVGGATASGTIKSSELGTVPLSGDYDVSTRTFALQGAGYQLTATVQGDNTVKGSGTYGTTTLSLVAMGTTSSAKSVKYCGRYTGNYVWSGGTEPGTGLLSFTIGGTESNRSFPVLGFAENSGDPVNPIVTLSGSAYLSLGKTPSTIGTSLAYMVLRIDGAPSSDIDGRWENQGWHGAYTTSDGVGVSSGTWSAWEC